MGTLSLVFGIILIVIGIVFLILTLMSPAPDNLLYTILFEAILIAGGAYLIRKYDDDKEKGKK